MANTTISIPAPSFNEPMQPGLRSFIVYDELPEGCIAFEIPDDRLMPHFRQGEFALVDTSDRDPMHGELFLIEWMNGDRNVIETGRWTYGVHPDETERLWCAYFQNTMISVGTGERQTSRWFDGPYVEAGFREKLVGRVIGIYEPDFRNQLREAA